MQTAEELTKLLDEEDEFYLWFKFSPEHRENYEDGNITSEDNYKNRLCFYNKSEKYLSD